MQISSLLSSFASTLQRRSRTATRRARKHAAVHNVALESLEDRALLAGSYLLGGPAAALTTSSGAWSWDGGANIGAAAAYRGAIQTGAYFGPSGIVDTTITTSNLSSITAATLAPLDGFISSWWSDSQTSLASATAVRDFFLAGNDLILLQDDSGHDRIGELLGVPTLPSNGSVSNDGPPLFVGPFGTTSNVTQSGNVGQLSATAIASRGGHIGAVNAAGQITAAYWDDGDYAPGAGRMLIVADVDMWSINFGSARYFPVNNNGKFALNGTAFIVASSNASPTAPTDSNSAANNVAEGAANGTAVGITASSTDPNGDTIVYSLTNNAGGRFTINPTTGVVTVLNGTLLDGPAAHTITVQSSDGNGGTATVNLSISVGNVAPSVALSGAPAVSEGSPYMLNLGAVTDPGADTITSYRINWGDGSPIQLFSGNPANTTATHIFADGPDTVTNNVTVTDEDGNFLAGSLGVLVLNVVPTIERTGNSNVEYVDEGSLYTLNLGAITDPGADTVSAYSINWGDGSPVENFTGSPANASKTHTYANGTNSYDIRVSLTDEDGTHADAGWFSVTVNNVAPTTPVDNVSDANQVAENAAAGTLVGITAASTDVGILDTVTYSLTDDAGGRFVINSSTGVVSVATGAVLDYEAATSHNITVQASDGEDATTQTFTINLLNQTATISGTVFVDADGDGLFDGGSETAIDSVIVELYNSAGGLIDTDLTELGGAYAFIVDDEFATYKIRETQPTGVNEGAAILGSAAGTVVSASEMQLTLQGSDATDYDFSEFGQAVQAGDTATIGFWQNKNGQALIQQGGPALVNWLNANFGNVFGNTFTDGLAGDTAAEVASFYKNQFFSQKLRGTPKVDAQFMATALATFFTSSNLSGGSVAASYGFNVTQTGIGTKVVNIGSSGAAFGVANNTNITIMAILLATNDLTGSGSGHRSIYDTNGDGVLDDNEKALRVLANNIYSALNEGGDI